MRFTGSIFKYYAEKGFGFIAESNSKNTHFFHITSCSFVPIEGQNVSFVIGVGRKGPAAFHVQLTPPLHGIDALAKGDNGGDQ